MNPNSLDQENFINVIRVKDYEEHINDDTDAKMYRVDTDGVTFYDAEGNIVLKATKNSLLWLGGSVIADSTRVAAEDVTSDTFIKDITVAAGQAADFWIYVYCNTPYVAEAIVNCKVVNYKTATFEPKIIGIVSEYASDPSRVTDIEINLSMATGSNTLRLTIKNASGGKLTYEARYRLAMATS